MPKEDEARKKAATATPWAELLQGLKATDGCTATFEVARMARWVAAECGVEVSAVTDAVRSWALSCAFPPGEIEQGLGLAADPRQPVGPPITANYRILRDGLVPTTVIVGRSAPVVAVPVEAAVPGCPDWASDSVKQEHAGLLQAYEDLETDYEAVEAAKARLQAEGEAQTSESESLWDLTRIAHKAKENALRRTLLYAEQVARFLESRRQDASQKFDKFIQERERVRSGLEAEYDKAGFSPRFKVGAIIGSQALINAEGRVNDAHSYTMQAAHPHDQRLHQLIERTQQELKNLAARMAASIE